MKRIKKLFYVIAPVAAFSYLAYEVASDSMASGMTRRGKAGSDLLTWITAWTGKVPLAVLLLAAGLLLSVYALRRY